MPQVFEFGPFRLDGRQRELSRAGEPIPLTPKAFDALLLLVERSPQLVSRSELIASLWPDTVVEDGNLSWNISAARKALSDAGAGDVWIETVPKYGYRFTGAVREIAAPDEPESTPGPEAATPTAVTAIAPPSRRRTWILAAAAVALLAGVAAWLAPWRSPPPVLEQRDWVLVGEVDNRTGDAQFDDVLTDTVKTQLSQSPFLTVYSQERVHEQLTQMRRPADARLTREVAKEIAERVGIKAWVSGSIVAVGNEYIVRLGAVNTQSGDDISRHEQTARNAQGVLRALGEATSAIRGDLGESVQSIARFAVPPETATTGSLEALRAFRLGQDALAAPDARLAKRFFARAIELDPDFALAYSRLGLAFSNLRDRKGSAAAAREAFLRRDRVSERERYEIAALYYRDVSGEMPQALEALQMWARSYPADARPYNSLQISQRDTGLLVEAAANGERAAELRPDAVIYRSNLIGSYLRLNRFDDARRVAETAIREGVDSLATHRLLQRIAILTDDRELDAREAQWRAGKSADATTVELDAALAAAAGRMTQARVGYGQAVKMTGDVPSRAADYLSRLALYEAYAGARAPAIAAAQRVLASDPARYVAADAAFVLALTTGDLATMTALAAEHPQDVLLADLWMPLARGVAALGAGRASDAIEPLRAMQRFDLGDYAFLRGSFHLGEAYLALKDAGQAQQAFQRVIDRRGIVPNQSLFALAHLGHARAAALAGNHVVARQSYERFLALWKDADAALPAIRLARAELAKLPGSRATQTH